MEMIYRMPEGSGEEETAGTFDAVYQPRAAFIGLHPVHPCQSRKGETPA